jgi:aminoacrylate hydrolase
MHYDVLGCTDDKATTVLLSAGLGGLGHFWRPQIEALGASHRVIVYDQRGTGANATELPNDYSIAHMADDVVTILDSAGVASCHFAGHALGGLIGLELARRHPSRLTSLVLVNAWARIDSHTHRCFEARMALLKHVGVEAYVRAQPIFLYPAAWLSEHEDAVRKEEALGIAHFQGADNLLKRVSALLAFDATSDLDAIVTPTFVAASRDDVLVPFTRSEQLARSLPDATLWLTPEGGHAFTVTDPAPFNVAMLAFLAKETHRRQADST